jgi:hypothetical protein
MNFGALTGSILLGELLIEQYSLPFSNSTLIYHLPRIIKAFLGL